MANHLAFSPFSSSSHAHTTSLANDSSWPSPLLIISYLGIGLAALLLFLISFTRRRSFVKFSCDGFLLRLPRLHRRPAEATESKGVRTLYISGFPLGIGELQVKDYLEKHTGVGTVYCLKVRQPRSRVTGRPSKWDYAIVQFTRRRFVDVILSMCSREDLFYGDSYLVAREMERDSVRQPLESVAAMSNSALHFGCRTSEDRFSVLFTSANNSEVAVEADAKVLHLFFPWKEVDYKLELPYESVREIQTFHSSAQRKDFMMFLLVAAPRIHVKAPSSQRNADRDERDYYKDLPDHRWVRTTDFTPSCGVGHSTAFCLELPFRCPLPEFARDIPYFKEFDADLLLEPGSSFSHNMHLVPIVHPSPGIKVPHAVLLKVNQAVQTGILPGPALDDRFFRLLNPDETPINYIEHAVERLFCSKNCCFDPVKWLRQQYAEYRKARHEPASSGSFPLDSGLVYVHRVQVTPTKVYFYGPEINVSNRVVRNYISDLDNFIRISFADEDGGRLRSSDLSLLMTTAADDEKQTNVSKRILSTLRDGVVVGDKKFELLAFSSSQLRENSAWMFAPRAGLDASDIRKWMGDFSSIRNIAKFSTRLGQSLSASIESPIVQKDDYEMIPDVMNKACYNFSDGIGKISVDFAIEVAGCCDMRTMPSAFQIRYGGFKGVVAIDPTLKKKLALRESMKKFESENLKLDILAHSKHQPCYLNRQIILLLSTLGVGDEIFERKQAALMESLDRILIDPARAQEELDSLFPGEITRVLKRLLSCGYKPGEEPFLSMMLQTLKASKLFELRTKTRIFVPKGRAMMGCLDETRTLDYGQVFVQVSYSRKRQFQDGGLFMYTERESARGTVVVTGKVVVSKNPCLHPGDVRTLLAVDVPDLHHMVDCVVFPQKGNRPHPNECAGSDLDGDVYFVSWDPELIPPRVVPPMDYTPPEMKILDHDISIEEVKEYFVDYMINDNMGIISNAHMVFADREERKAESKECLTLAKLFSIAVDYPKTGEPANIPGHLRVKEYPDFMERHDKDASYESKGVIGKLFRAVRDYAPPPSYSDLAKEFTRSDAAQFYDPDMEVSGFKDHLDDASYFKGEYDSRLGILMDQYGIKTEAEFLLGGGSILKTSKPPSRSKDKDALRLALKSLRKEAKGWFSKGDDPGGQLDEDALHAKASAWYHVTYHPDYWGMFSEGLNKPHFLSFPWCIYERLGCIKQMNMRRRKASQITQRVATALRI